MVGAAHLSLVDGAVDLDAESAVFEAMLDGWRAQQLARSLSFATIDAGARVGAPLRRIGRSPPWHWTPAMFDVWLARLRREQRAPSTLRGYQLSVRAFLAYVCDPLYGWDTECLTGFGNHPTQICSGANSMAHVVEAEGRPGRRSMKMAECQNLFDAAMPGPSGSGRAQGLGTSVLRRYHAQGGLRVGACAATSW